MQETAALKLLAVRAGASRLSIFADEVVIAGEPIEAKGFMRFVILADPEGNTVGIAQHQRDPFAPI